MNSSSTGTGGGSATQRRAASSITATAALLSAPRIAVVAVAPHAVLADGLDRAGQRDGVEVRAQQDAARRRPPSARGIAREQVAGVRAGERPGVVLLDRQPEPAQLRGDAVRARALAPERALDRAQLREQLVERARARPRRRALTPSLGAR